MKRLSLEWTKGLSDLDAKSLTESVESNYHIIEKIQGILDAKLRAITKERTEKSTFELPAWSEYQAYLLGQEKLLIDLQTLLTLRD